MAITLQESLRGLFYAPFYVALARDAYAAEGVEVRFASSPQPGDAARNVMDGTVDVCWGGPMRVMQAYQQIVGCDLVSFAEVVTRDPFLLVGREPRPDFALGDLAGVRVATVSEVPTPWMCLQEDLRRAGVDPDRLTRVADRTMAENVEALRRGDVDVVQVFEPFAAMLLGDGVGHVWYVQASRGPTSYTTFYARRGLLRERREELHRHGARDLSDTEMGCGRRWCGDRCCHRTVFRGCAARGACGCLWTIQIARHLGRRPTIASYWLRSLVGEPRVRRVRLARYDV